MAEEVDCLKKTMAVRVTRGLDFPEGKKGSEEEGTMHLVISIKEQAHESKKNTGPMTEPNWGETFYFDVSRVEMPAPDVFIVAEIFSSHKLRDEVIGVVRVPIDNHIDVRFTIAREQLYPVVWDEKFKGAKKPATLGLQLGIADRLGADGFTAEAIPVYTESQLNQMSADEVYTAAILVAEKSHELMDRIERMAAQSESIGAATAKKLVEQTEQLKILDRKVEELHHVVEEGLRIEKEINACCLTRCFTSCFARKSMKKKLRKREKATDAFEKKQEMQEMQRLEEKESEEEAKAKQSAKDQRLAAKEEAKRRKKEPQIERGDLGVSRSEQEEKYLQLKKRLDERLDRLKGTVEQLMNLANAMGDELDKHNERIERLDVNMADGQNQLNKAIVGAKKAI